MFNLGATTSQEIEKEYADKKYLFEEISFLEKLAVCVQIYEIVANADIDEFKIAFRIFEYENSDNISILPSEKSGNLPIGYYFDIKSDKYKIDYFSYEKHDLGENYSLTKNGSQEYAKKRNNVNYIHYKELIALNDVGRWALDNWEVDNMLREKIGDVLKPDLGQIIATLGGRQMHETWSIAQEKNKLEKEVAKKGLDTTHKNSSKANMEYKI